MKILGRICLILALFSSHSAWAIPHLSSGMPGCLQFVIERPMDERTAAGLTPNCKELRSAYLESLKTYAKSPQKFRKELTAALQAKRAAGPAYRAVLLAALYRDSSLISALKARSKDRYASAAVERIRLGHCTEAYRDRRYDEVCRLASPVVSRIVELATKGAK